MILYPDVKKFIENYIKDIEEENMEYIFEQSLSELNDVEFNQLYDILQDLPLQYDIDDPIYDIISDKCSYIINVNPDSFICIEEEWRRLIGINYLGNKDLIISKFNDFDIEVKNGDHWCQIYW